MADDDGRQRFVDVAVVAALTVMAAVRRWGTLPEDGLWFDDAWVAAGALHGELSQLPARGSAHPGFTLLLQVWEGVFGGAPDSLAWPALVVGVVTPAVVYLGLRRLDFARWTAVLAAAVLVVSDIHTLYAGRVKSYVIDALVVMVLAAVLPRLAGRRWTWATAAAWTVAAVAVSSFSGYQLVATAIAIVVLVLHAAGDRRIRVVALLVQATAQAGMYLAARGTTDLDAIEEYMESAYDGHLSVYRNPVTMLDQVLDHLGRIVEVYPGGPSWALAPLGVAALVALGASALGWGDRRRRVTSRFLLGCIGFAFVGGVLNRFPFGPSNSNFAAAAGSPGGRHSMWLTPVFVVGLALCVEALRRLVPDRAGAGPDAVLAAASVAVLAVAWSPAPGYVETHSASASRFAERAAGGDGLVIALDTQAYTFASSTDRDIKLLETPESMVGFSPVAADGRVLALGEWATVPYSDAVVRRLAVDEDLVVVYGAFLGRGSTAIAATALDSEGFRPVDQLLQGNDVVQVFERRAGTAG